MTSPDNAELYKYIYKYLKQSLNSTQRVIIKTLCENRILKMMWPTGRNNKEGRNRTEEKNKKTQSNDTLYPYCINDDTEYKSFEYNN
jgi:hypothetical protein